MDVNHVFLCHCHHRLVSISEIRSSPNSRGLSSHHSNRGYWVDPPRRAITVFLQKTKMKAAELDRKIEDVAKKGYHATKQLYKKIMRRVRGNDVRYFNTTKRGDINDWRKQLHGLNKKEVGRTMKCVIAAMTVGTDVSSLFPDVISCIHNETLELKKLVYLSPPSSSSHS